MTSQSLVPYFADFNRHSTGLAYLDRRGYRSLPWPYRRLVGVAYQFARELEARNLAPGQRVVLWGENSAEWAAAFWGCVLQGAVVVPMDHAAAADFALRVATQVDAKLVVCAREHLRTVAGWPALALEDLAERVTARSARPYTSPLIERDQILQIVFTSGTTAEPRGVAISHGNLLANLEPLEREIQKYLKYERFFHPLRLLNLVPLSHIFGQFLGLFVPPLLGATVGFQRSMNPTEILRTIKNQRISVLVAVPRVLETLRAKIERDLEAEGRTKWFEEQTEAAAKERWVSRLWRFRRIHRRFGWKFWAFVSGGAALPPATELFWDRLGFAVIQGYGLTETTSLVSVNHPFRPGRGSIGKILPGREVKLDTNGEILVRGDNIASGYWENGKLKPMLAGSGEDGGWLHTGDLGGMDGSGNLYFKGRKKNVIVTSAGMNVHPEDLEAALRRLAGVRDCVVVGLDREGNAEACAVLILREDGQDAGAIVRQANESLAEHQRMRHWFVWLDPDFPRTGTEKPRTDVIARVVRERIDQQNSRAAPRTGASTAPKGRLAELIAGVTSRDPSQFRPDLHLEKDLNLSSLDRVALMGAIEDRYQIDLNETKFCAAKSIAELEELLGQTSRGPSDYEYPRWAQRWPIRWIRLAVYYLLVWPITHLLAYPRVHGRERLRGVDPPVLVVSNHVTERMDLAFVLRALPPRFRHHLATAAGGETLEAIGRPPADSHLFRRLGSRLKYLSVVGLFNIFPLPRQSGFRGSFQFAGESVDRGYSILVFPEGEHTRDGAIAPFRAGVGLLATQLAIPVLPMRIDGLYEAKQSGRRWAWPGRIRVNIGAPVRFSAEADPQQIARDLECRVRAL